MHSIILYAPGQVRNNSVHCQVYISTKLRRHGSLVTLSITWLKKKLAIPSLEPPILSASKVPIQRLFYECLRFENCWSIPIRHKLCLKPLKVTVPLWFFLCNSATLPMDSMTLPLWCGSLLLKLETLAGDSLQMLQSLKVRYPAPCFVFFSFPWQGSEEAYQSIVTLK